MVDYKIVCSMCGDVGFQDKLFRCSKCLDRFQHSYCSNYYSESIEEAIQVCEWCMSEEKSSTCSSSKHTGGSSSSARKSAGAGGRNNNEKGSGSTHGVMVNSKRSEYSGERIKQHDREEVAERVLKNPTTGTPSPRTSTRRYKLLKDVMC